MAKRGTDLQYKIIDLFVQGKSRQDIATELECSVQTVDRVKADPELRRVYYERCNDQIEELVPAAIKRLRGIINDDKQQGSVHVAAVREVLDRSHLAELLEKTDKEIKITVSYE